MKKEIEGYYVSSTEDVEEERMDVKPEVFDVFRYVDDRGVLTQTFEDNFIPKRCYEIKDREGVIRGMHGHKVEGKLVYVVKGLVKFVVFPMHLYEAGGPAVYKQEFVLSSDKPQALVIPPGYYHGFKSLKNSIIHFYSDSSLEESKKDDFRTSPLKEWFEVKPR